MPSFAEDGTRVRDSMNDIVTFLRSIGISLAIPEETILRGRLVNLVLVAQIAQVKECRISVDKER